jgi:hypothetical protein
LITLWWLRVAEALPHLLVVAVALVGLELALRLLLPPVLRMRLL